MDKAYYIEDRDLDLLRKINRALFGDGRTLSPDERRDIANMLHVIITHIEQNSIEEEFDAKTCPCVI